MSRIKCGWSSRSITPSHSMVLGGYRPARTSTGVHDDIEVKSLMIEYEQTKIMFVMLDLVAVDERFTKQLKQQLSELAGEECEFIISATHTHSAPAGTVDTSAGLLKGLDDVFGSWDEEYIHFISTQTSEAVRECMDRATVSSIKFVDTVIEGVGKNRNNENYYADNRLFAMEIVNEQGNKALMWHYSCHPTVLGKNNRKVTQDFPGAVERELTNYDWVGFLNGAAGDLSTRFTRKESSFSEAERFGKLLADKIKAEMQKQPQTTLDRIEYEHYSLKLKTVSHPDNYNNLNSRINKFKSNNFTNNTEQQILGKQTYRVLKSNLENQPVLKIDLNVLNLNHYTFVTFPGEVYSSLLEKLFNTTDTRIIGYANGYHLYLTDQKAFEEKNYEALSSPFMQGEGERLQEFLENRL